MQLKPFNHDTRLEPTHVAVGCLPIHGLPVYVSVESRTSSLAQLCRHLPCFLNRFAKFSCEE